MKGGSLRWRLIAGGMLAILAALAVAWLAMTWLFERHIVRRETAELTRTGQALAAGLRLEPGGAPAIDVALPDPRLSKAAGGLYWQVSSPAGVQRSVSLWDQALKPSGEAHADDWSARIAAGPFDDRILLVERSVRPDRGGPAVLIQVASDEKALRAARAEFGRDLALFLAGLWVVLSAAAALQVTLGLSPLARVREELARLRKSPSARMSDDHPREIAPLAQAINALAEAREADLARARRRAGDLAHGLKTPLSALSAQSRRAREAGAVEAADGLDDAIAAVAAALEAELARARAAAAREATFTSRTAPLAVAERLVAVLERTAEGERLMFDIEIPPALRVPASEDVVTEMLGALIENAARFARRRVRVSGASGEDGPMADGPALFVEDDGPGMDEGRAEAALARGARLDEAGPGHGLGLAIVRDLAEASGATLRMDRSMLGGLRAIIAWKSSVF
ncbi:MULTISPECIES: sensor histidine kinase [unclassified Caulobacter]|uniref:sensor histidine kinase n=1 Tax=unclassified Caulobacter TaxID=2648921 RepID=UPI0006F880C4|nr:MULTISPECIES: sensor histidine kinase [unclassified Caulobacter]KQV56880.1 histidine kinase [Caulobacter sp. Root342]KQV72519.1 histidine kinase [Caulobacter sp. Root343]